LCGLVGGHEACPDPNVLALYFAVSCRSVFPLIEDLFNQSCTMNLDLKVNFTYKGLSITLNARTWAWELSELVVRQSFVATLTPTSGTKAVQRTAGQKELRKLAYSLRGQAGRYL